MNPSVTPQKMLDSYGLQNTIYFPQATGVEFHTPSANLLSTVGLPHSEVFISREEVPNPYPESLDSITLGSRFDHFDTPCPPESRAWWALGYLFETLVAVDPQSGKVYGFPEGEPGYTELHRDVESLLFTLIEFRKLEVDHDNDVDPEVLSARFKQVVGAFDSTPFADENSQWNQSLEELENGIW
ncbi:SUKH-4 family immunity protein [Streptomyces roseolus]|uniref:SUKH-4 family immunity protein n=1 Tax=Streptomyces roseolus TaxID=67358 RepID=UPI0036E3D3B3